MVVTKGWHHLKSVLVALFILSSEKTLIWFLIMVFSLAQEPHAGIIGVTLRESYISIVFKSLSLYRLQCL